MRELSRDIFLHFLNRDSRQIYGLFADQSDERHLFALCRALNISALLCDDRCIAPPGFVVECDIAGAALERKKYYLSERLIELPMREASIGDFVEKKRTEYSAVRDRYQGIFSDHKVTQLANFAESIIRRTNEVGTGIAKEWREGPDTRRRLWRPLLSALPAKAIEDLSATPDRLRDRGIAVTWPSIAEAMPTMDDGSAKLSRRVLQNSYFRQYAQEYNLVVIRNIPMMTDHFDLPTIPKIYDFGRFNGVLSMLHLSKTLLDASDEAILELRRHPGYIHFLDAYRKTAWAAEQVSALKFAVGRAALTSKFQWEKFTAASDLTSGAALGLSGGRMAELGDALSAVADTLLARADIQKAGVGKTVEVGGRRQLNLGGSAMPEIVLFVALSEELDVLVRRWNLSKSATWPAATGMIGARAIDVLCPRDMGRVPAAIEVTRYLEHRRGNPPAIILAVGLAGGFDSEGVHAGNIIVPTNVADLASRKIRGGDADARTEFRRRDFAPTAALSSTLESDAFDKNSWERKAIDEAEWPDGFRPSLKYGPIACVDEVISDKEWQEELTAACPKLHGVDMESGGVCASAEKYKVPVAILRTVSDGADPAKKDTPWRKIGMKTLAILLEGVDFNQLLGLVRTPGG